MSTPLTPDFFQHETPPESASRWVIGFSGGLDSTALLKLCVSYRDRYQPELALLAVHVNHGLNDAADDWQAHCEAVCKSWQVPIVTRQVKISSRSRKSTEQLARQARYDCFRQLTGAEDLLLLGHHLDDQAETILYRLLRGSGTLGMSSMAPYTRANRLAVWRPLLSVTRSALEEMVCREGLSWIEDPSNQDRIHDRNYIRHQVMPLLTERWPGARQTLGRSARLAAESAELNDALAVLDLGAIEDPALPGRLAIPPLQSLTLPRLKNCLRYWLRQHGASLPSEQVLLQIVGVIREYHPEQKTLIDWADPGVGEHGIGEHGAGNAGRWECRTFNSGLWLMAATDTPDLKWQAILEPESILDLPAGLGALALESISRKAVEGKATNVLQPEKLDQPLTVKFRRGGERFQPPNRPARPLKKWLHEWQVPPWERDRLPLLFCGDELIWVPGHGVAEGYRLNSAEGPVGVRIKWLKPGNRFNWF